VFYVSSDESLGKFLLMPWADRPFNILGLCPNCNTLAKYGGKRDISNIFVEAKDLFKGNTLKCEL
jgi:hypothetical protein